VMWVDECAEAFDAYLWSEKGILPYSGGHAEQPALIMQAIDIVAAEHALYQKESLECQQQAKS